MIHSMRVGLPFVLTALAVACSSAPDAESFPLETGGAVEQPQAGGGQAPIGAAGPGGTGAGGLFASGGAGVKNPPPAAGGSSGAPAVGGNSAFAGSGGAAASGGAGSPSSGGSPNGGSPNGGRGGSAGSSGGGSTSQVSYSTSFDTAESPLSEGGKWKQNNKWFTRVVAAGGRAHGTSPNPANDGVYEDSYAFLGGMGFPPNQYASAHIYKDKQTGGYLEVELLLRWADSANSTRGYECYLHQNGEYITVTRWNGGALNAPATIEYFSILGGQSNITAPKDGDLFEAQIVGNTITVKLAGATLLTMDVSKFDGAVFESGDPGIGFDAGASGAETADSTYGLKDFSAKGL